MKVLFTEASVIIIIFSFFLINFFCFKYCQKKLTQTGCLTDQISLFNYLHNILKFNEEFSVKLIGRWELYDRNIKTQGIIPQGITTTETSIIKHDNFYWFSNHLKPRGFEFRKVYFRKYFGDTVTLIKNRKIKTQITSEWFLLCQRALVHKTFTLLSSSISRNFSKTILCLKDIANKAEIIKCS